MPRPPNRSKRRAARAPRDDRRSLPAAKAAASSGESPATRRHAFRIAGLDRHGLEAFRLELQRIGRIEGFVVREFRVEGEESG